MADPQRPVAASAGITEGGLNNHLLRYVEHAGDYPADTRSFRGQKASPQGEVAASAS